MYEDNKGKDQGKTMIGTKGTNNEMEEWLNRSVKKFRGSIRRFKGTSEADNNSKYYRHILWKVNFTHTPSKKCFDLISRFLNYFGMDLIKKEGISYHFRQVYEDIIKIHVKVHQEENCFRINAHIDIDPHKEVLYNDVTSGLLCDLSDFLTSKVVQSQVILISKHHKKNEEQEKSETIDLNISINDAVRNHFSSKKAQIINEITFRSFKRNQFLSYEKTKFLIQELFFKGFELINDKKHICYELEVLIDKEIDEIIAIAKQQFEARLKENRDLSIRRESLSKRQKSTVIKVKTQDYNIHKRNKKRKVIKSVDKKKAEKEEKDERKQQDIIAMQKKERRINNWKKLIMDKFLELLDEEFEKQRANNRTSLNINIIKNKVNKFFREKLKSEVPKGKKYFSEAFKILESKEVLSNFNKTKSLLEELVFTQIESENREKEEFKSLLERFLKEVYSQIHSNAVADELHNLEKNEVIVWIINSFERRSGTMGFNYIEPIAKVKEYFYSQKFKDDFSKLQCDVRKDIKRFRKERERERKEKLKDSLFQLYIILGIVGFIILIGICMYIMILMNPI